MRANSLIEALPGDFTLTLVDVGSAGGLNKRWRPFAPLLSSVLFDPREPAATGEFGRGATRVYPVALGDKAGEADLYLTALPNMSSFLRPDPNQFARFGRKEGDAAIVSTESVPIETLDELSRRDGFRADVLKVDTQGSELLVLKGAGEALKSTLLAEIEVSFFRRYADQPLFADIEAFMATHGFELIDLLKLKRYRSSNSLHIRNAGVPKKERSGRVAYGDAIFLRSRETILCAAKADSGESLLRAVVALVAYGKADIAAQLVDEGADLLKPGRVAAVRKALKTLPARGGLGGLLGRLLGKG